LGYEILRRQGDRSVLGQLRDWFRRRTPTNSREAPPTEPEPLVTSNGRLHPQDGETAAEFADRIARIKADVLRRALAAIGDDSVVGGKALAEGPAEHE